MICNRCKQDFDYSFRDSKSDDFQKFETLYAKEDFYCIKCTILNILEDKKKMEEVLTCGNCKGQTWYISSGRFKCKECNAEITIPGIIIDVTRLNKDQEKKK